MFRLVGAKGHGFRRLLPRKEMMEKGRRIRGMLALALALMEGARFGTEIEDISVHGSVSIAGLVMTT